MFSRRVSSVLLWIARGDNKGVEYYQRLLSRTKTSRQSVYTKYQVLMMLPATIERMEILKDPRDPPSGRRSPAARARLKCWFTCDQSCASPSRCCHLAHSILPGRAALTEGAFKHPLNIRHRDKCPRWGIIRSNRKAPALCRSIALIWVR
jgi:hypothetical protein